ncbi:hypothetical protein E1292_06260 [Nonomuraea deserti]|uniref:PPE domain-containing protein n=1 Tax=Nonomuraea deserti TaxID=1848322 RepID=A0A4R4VYK6_9ACTN|nr:hypothetical protein [Nonomuraea deserti]TDD11259.1 hypothetical protein E1292_06260 [Nonomuraea deserti]
MPEPKPIKSGSLQGGNPDGYGGREEIRRMVMGTRPEEFGPVADAYRSASELLTTTITTLGDSAARLVGDGAWGGESAGAMLTRMKRLQTYLQALRDGVDAVPPSLEMVSRELASAKERFDQATEQRMYWVEASGMGAGQSMPANDPNADARKFMTELNGVYHEAYEAMPDRLPWDAELASPAPYMPPPEQIATPLGSGHGTPPYDGTAPAAADLAATPGSSTAPAGSPPGALAGGPGPGNTGGGPPAGTAGGPPTGTAGTPQPVAPSTMTGLTGLTGLAPAAARPPAPGTPPAGVPVTGPPATTPVPSLRRDGGPYPSTGHDPSAASEPGRTRSVAAETGPSVRPGAVPVVGASPSPTVTPVGAREPGTTATGGVPFLPMGGAVPQDARSGRRSLTPKSDGDFFRPEIDCGPPVVG